MKSTPCHGSTRMNTDQTRKRQTDNPDAMSAFARARPRRCATGPALASIRVHPRQSVANTTLYTP